MNLLEFRAFLNSLPEEDLDVSLMAAKVYDIGEGQEARLDMPILNFFIDPKEKEACFVVQADQAGLDYILQLVQQQNIQDETSTPTA